MVEANAELCTVESSPCPVLTVTREKLGRLRLKLHLLVGLFGGLFGGLLVGLLLVATMAAAGPMWRLVGERKGPEVKEEADIGRRALFELLTLKGWRSFASKTVAAVSAAPGRTEPLATLCLMLEL